MHEFESAPSAMSSGGLSPMGEPLAMLPPMVPDARTCFDPAVAAPSRKSGSIAGKRIERLRIGRARANAHGGPLVSTAANPAALPVWMIFGRSRSCLVIHSPTSVPPVRIVASGCCAHSAARLSMLAGRGEEAVRRADEKVLVHPAWPEASRRVCINAGGERVARSSIDRIQRGIGDRPVAGAAAKISRQTVVDRLPVRLDAGMVEREEAHHDAGRAEAALRAVMGHHRLLDGVQFPAFGQIVDGDDVLAVALAKELDACIDRLVDENAVPDPARGHGAGAAIALVAALLRSLRAFAQTQIVEQRLVRADVRKLHALPVAGEDQPVPGHAILQKIYRPVKLVQQGKGAIRPVTKKPRGCPARLVFQGRFVAYLPTVASTSETARC